MTRVAVALHEDDEEFDFPRNPNHSDERYAYHARIDRFGPTSVHTPDPLCSDDDYEFEEADLEGSPTLLDDQVWRG